MRTASKGLDSAIACPLDALGLALINCQAVAFFGISPDSAEDMATMEAYSQSMARMRCASPSHSPSQIHNSYSLSR